MAHIEIYIDKGGLTLLDVDAVDDMPHSIIPAFDWKNIVGILMGHHAEAILNKVRRTWVYVQAPYEYEISGCPTCNNEEPEWSEFVGHLWCAKCQQDFVPKDDGIFDGPIPVNACRLMGICFDRLNLITAQIDHFDP